MAIEAVRRVSESVADTEVRTCRRCKIGTCAASQGDVYVHRVADDHPRGAMLGTRQVAVGTNAGARHVAEGDGVRVHAGVSLPPDLTCPDWARPEDMLGPVVVAGGPWTLTHPEHAHHALPAGTWQVTYQLDFSTRRRVQD